MPDVRPIGVGLLGSKSNYFRGPDRTKWVMGAANYAGAKYSNLLPGVDLTFYRGPNDEHRTSVSECESIIRAVGTQPNFLSPVLFKNRRQFA